MCPRNALPVLPLFASARHRFSCPPTPSLRFQRRAERKESQQTAETYFDGKPGPCPGDLYLSLALAWCACVLTTVCVLARCKSRSNSFQQRIGFQNAGLGIIAGSLISRVRVRSCCASWHMRATSGSPALSGSLQQQKHACMRGCWLW